MTSEPIPGPRGLPLLGNLLDVAASGPVITQIERLADTYGPIFQLHLKGKRALVVSSAQLVDELVDEKKFRKEPPAALEKKPGGATGLFSARSDDPDWGQAHRVLAPAFSPLSIEDMFDDMKDIAMQLVLKWGRQGPEKPILATDDFTRLTLDTIALCAMGYRFNSFYSEDMHPFVDAMLGVLSERGIRSSQPAFVQNFRRAAQAQFQQDEETMQNTCQEIIDKRRENPTEKPDLLNAMLDGKDPKTGKKMRDQLVISNMITFLVAGHETTSGLLSFTIYYLLKNPQAYLKAQKEVDDVIGKAPIEAKHLKDLKYIAACLKEAIRLAPTAPALSKMINPDYSKEPVLLGGKYLVEPSDRVLILLTKSQRDPAIYGEDAEEFKPERMLDEEFDKLISGAWKPFGNGSRACIGRPFAWQEAVLVMAIVLQNFDLQLENPSYTLQIKQALTIKPKDLYIKASPRNGVDITKLDQSIHHSSSVPDQITKKGGIDQTLAGGEKRKLNIYFGSNSGTCQSFAQRLASDSSRLGFQPTVMSMDEGVGNLPKQTPVVVITSSYEGQPPDNAARFVDWLQTLREKDLDGVDFTVFGAGHKDWNKTFHRIPNLVRDSMSKSGAHEIAPMGLVDVAGGDLYSNFEDWLEHQLWPGLSTSQDPSALSDVDADVQISTEARSKNLRYDLSMGLVKSTECLTAPGEPAKFHTEIELPSDMTYECGDYLAVLPLNSDETIRRVMAHFKLPWDATIKTGERGVGTLPGNMEISIYEALRSYVELSQPATKQDINKLLQRTEDTKTQEQLKLFTEDQKVFESEILGKRMSVLNLLRRFPEIQLSFASFLALLPALHVRQYSISSSPLATPSICSITYSVIDKPSFNDKEVQYQGVASTYLRTLKPGDLVQIAVRPTKKSTFRIPVDPEKTPMLMFAAGTGVAPFRGFLQQRAIMLEQNPQRTLAKAVLFAGCRSKTRDRLFAKEIDEWIQKGVVDVRYAFSKESDASEKCKYLGDRITCDEELVRQMWADGARIYVCGSRAVQESVGTAANKIALERALKREGFVDNEENRLKVKEWFKNMAAERVAVDVFD